MSVSPMLKFCGLAAVFVLCARAEAQTAKEAPGVSREAAATLVVFNQDDRESVALAKFYAEKRAIPKNQVVGLKCAKTEEITRTEYDETIAKPLREKFNANGWWKLRSTESPLGPVESNKIRFVALIRGIPLKIAAMPLYEGDKITGPAPVGEANQASVDAEVAVLGYRTRIISGAMNNLYFRSYMPIAEAGRPELMLTCRLDAPTAETVRRMITDSIAAEQEGLTGMAYVDARGLTDPGYIVGDDWLFSLANTARRRGMPTVLDNGPGIFPSSYPMTKAAMYFGWYAENLSGPFVQPDFRFVRGAIAVHIHSFSASSLRDPLRNWAAPLVSAGAAATLGNVYEPYLALTPHLDILHDRLRAGLTFAESAFMAQRVLSWMTTCVGDPLYRPFKGAAELGERPVSGEWADYRQAARSWFSAERAEADAALRAAAKKNRSGMTMEGLGLLQLSVDDREAALASFEEARALYGPTADSLRVAVHEVMQLKAANREAEARVLVRRVTAKAADLPAADLLRALVQPPPPPAATPAPPPATPAKR